MKPEDDRWFGQSGRVKRIRPDRAAIVGIGTALSGAIALISQLAVQDSILAVLLGLGGVTLTGIVAAMSVRERRVARVTSDLATTDGTSIWNVPRQLANFHDRQEEMGAIEQKMSRAGPEITVLQGVGGAGKSSLAAAYAARHRESLDVCWWVNASEPRALLAGLASLASRMGFSVANQRAAALAALNALAGRRWLVIFDDALSPDALAPFARSLIGGKVIVTSRNPSWRHLAQTIVVSPFDEPTAIEFLLEGTGSADAESAGLIARYLGGLPLALDIAIGHSNESGRSLDDLGQAYGLNPVDTLAAQGGSQQMPWQLGLKELAAKNPVAAQVLNFLAFGEPNEPLPRLFLEQAARYLPAKIASVVTDPARLDGAVSLLVKMALIQIPRSGEFVIHPLTRDAVLRRLPRGKTGYMAFRRSWEPADWLRAWLLALADVYGTLDHTFDRWMLLSPLVTHGERILTEASTLDVHALQRAKLSTYLARYYLDRGLLENAYGRATSGMEWASIAVGANHPDTVDAKLMLGWVSHVRGEYDAAILLLDEVLHAREIVLGAEHASTLEAMNALAGALVDSGTPEGIQRGLELNRRLYAARCAAEGQEGPFALISLHNLSSALLACGEYLQARKGYERALAGQRKLYGENHPRPLIVQHRLAQVFAKLGDLASATELSEETLVKRRRLLGDQHPDVIASQVQLADLLVGQGRKQEATDHYRQALGSAKLAYESGHRLLNDIEDKLISTDSTEP